MDCDTPNAKTNLSKLIEQVECGEEVLLIRRGERVAWLTPVAKPEPQFGRLQGKVGTIDDDLLFAMTGDEADRFIDGK